MVRAFVGLGSNLGEREVTLRAAIGRLRGQPDIEVKRVSAFRDTEPVGYVDQPRFLNGVVEQASPHNLFRQAVLHGQIRALQHEIAC